MHLVLAAILAFAAPAAPAEEELAPLSDQAYSEDLEEAGFRNGRMPDHRLIEVAGCLLERDAAYTLSLMMEAAAEDGITLEPTWCYRTLSQQRQTYDRNCPVETVEVPLLDPSTGEQLVDEDGEPMVREERRRECTVPTASPSTSNHGWGRAIDFTHWGRPLSCGDADFRWLQEHAAEFGWVHPAWAGCNRQTAEPWHWEWAGLGAGLPLATQLPSVVEPPANAE